jgi:hypothetical protein
MATKKPKEKEFVIQKRVKATSVADALRKEKKAEVDEVWVDKKAMQAGRDLPPMIGFGMERRDDDGDDE